MHVRVVRFTGVTADRMNSVKAQIDGSDGPPPGVKSTGLQIGFDEGQGTAVALQFFETEADMQEAERILDAMDAGETPGTRSSIDRTEVIVEVDV